MLVELFGGGNGNTRFLHAPNRIKNAICRTCNNRPACIEVASSPLLRGWDVTARCHGVSETIFVRMNDPEDLHWGDMFVFFRRNRAEARRPTIRELLERATK